MTTPDTTAPWTPRLAPLWAWVVFTLVALSIFHPMLTGQYLAGDDQVLAGYGFRQFGAEFFREHGRIPQWNPYLFGGLPFFAVIGHGDIFYPTAWLRWIVATDVGMTLGFFAHVVIAGGATYALCRGLRMSWTAAVVAGVGYQLSGIVASQVSPGHDGKLFVAALAPLAFLALLKAIRHGRLGAYGAFALVIGLAILTPHVQMAYYLMVASGVFTLWLVFLDPERNREGTPFRPMALALVAVLLGLGIAMIQMLPILTHVPFTPRGEGGDSVGWDYATSYAYHLKELPTLVMPQFNGVLEHYWGDNFFKSHTEYLGALIVVLAILGLGAARRQGMLLGLGLVAGLFFLVSVAADTPFYRLWYEVMPMMKSVRAAGMAFILVALPVCVWAGFGVDRLLRREVPAPLLWWPLGVLAAFAVLGAVGALQPVTEALADERTLGAAIGNADALRAGAVRLLAVVLVGGAVMVAVRRGVLAGAAAAAALVVAVAGDNWSILHRFANWLPPAEVTYASDELIDTMKRRDLPWRAYDPAGGAAGASAYQGSVLMAHDVPTLFGYHGMESKWFDELFGGKGEWQAQLSPSLWDLYGVQYVTLNQPVDALPGFHQVLGPVAFPNLINRTPAGTGYLFERDSSARWVRVVPGAVLVPEDRIAATVADPGFPVDGVVLFPDTATVTGASATVAIPDPTPVTARLATWEPGAMTVTIDGADSRTTYLLVAENWYPDWKARVDGVEVPVHRGNTAMVSVALPPGARQVELRFDMDAYRQGKLVTLVSLLGVAGFFGAGWRQGRRRDG